MKTTISGLKLDMVVILLSRLKMSLRNCCFSIIPKSNHLMPEVLIICSAYGRMKSYAVRRVPLEA